MKLSRERLAGGATLIEVIVASLLVGGFFASVFEVNAVCLRIIGAGKETMGAISDVQDRAETLRNLSFRNLTDPTFVSGVLSPAANSSDFAQRAVEVVKLTAYPTANGVTQFTRNPNGTVTTNSTAASLGNSLVRIDVSCTWNASMGGRPRTEQATTIVSNGTKK